MNEYNRVKAFYNKLMSYQCQHGFRQGTGMPDAFADLVKHVTWIFDEHKDVYVDVGKVFDKSQYLIPYKRLSRHYSCVVS